MGTTLEKGIPSPLFPLGQLFTTPGALAAMLAAGDSPAHFLSRHARGDWGDLDGFDHLQNAEALRDGLRILSAYQTSGGVKLWVITEADRATTTILLPEEY